MKTFDVVFEANNHGEVIRGYVRVQAVDKIKAQLKLKYILTERLFKGSTIIDVKEVD